MVFSSLPSYVDPPSWPQQQSAGGVGDDHEICRRPPPVPSMGRSVHILEAGRMADSSAMMKCPRCESTNTKFCYFNNYSLSQPRHFCKTCRRYWTRGGALRNVPVGGGCRRNKKSNKGTASSRSSKTPSSTSCNSTPINIISPPSAAAAAAAAAAADMMLSPHFPILHHFGGGDLGLTYGTAGNIIINNVGTADDHLFNLRSKFTHFPIMEANSSNGGIMFGEGPSNYAGIMMKMEETHQGSRNFLSDSVTGNDQILRTSNVAWGTTALTGFTTTTTTHPL